jgi:hypothetical protein
VTTLKVAEIFKRAGYLPHPAQKLVHGDGTRNRVVAGGRRIGKSEIGAGELDIEAVRTRMCLNYLEDKGIRREFWIVGPGYTDAEKEFRKHYNALKRMEAPFDRPGTYYDAHSGDMQISMYGGKYLVIGKSAMHPERLVGEGLSGVIMAEAAKQKERTWTKFIRPTLADFQGWSLHSSTPEGKNWFYDAWQRGQDPNDDEWKSWRFGSWRNPIVFPLGASPQGLHLLRTAINERAPITSALRKKSGVDPEIIEMMLDLAEETFNQEVAAMFTEFTGRVFKRFDEDIHVGDFNYDPSCKLYAAVDYGFVDPFVWLLIQEDWQGNVTVLDEIYQSGLTIDDAARLVDERGLCPGGLIEFFPDPARPDETLALERHLKVRANRNTGGELRIRLRYITEALRDRNRHLPEGDPLRFPMLRINRKCTNTIREMQDYRYPDTSKDQKRNPKDVPVDKDNHCPEALGRYYRGRYGDPSMASPGGGSKVRSTNLSRGRN